MQPLDDIRRQKLLALSAALCLTAIVLAPLAARPAFDAPGNRGIHPPDLELPSLPLMWKPADVRLRRDPFVRAALGSRPSTAHTTAAAQPIVVRAIVTGARPRALVESGGVSRIVPRGGLLLGARVVQIDQAGIHLSNGATLSLPEVQQ